VTDNDPPAIGARLALSHGVSGAITMAERELMALGRTVASSGTMLETMTHLGERLSAFDINAAPISVPTRAAHPHDERGEQWSSAQERAHTPSAYWPTADDVPKPQVQLDQAQPPRTLAMPRPDASLIEPHQVASQSAAITPRKPPQLTTPIASLVPGVVAAPAAPASVEPPPSVAASDHAPSPSSAPDNDVLIRSLLPQAIAQPVPIAPTTATDNIGTPRENSLLQRIVIGAVAPGLTSQSTLPTFATQNVAPPDRVVSNTAEPLNVSPDKAAQPEVPQSRAAPAESPQAESEPRQGTIILDGAQLGQWVIDHLEKYASRPGAMTTGIDPRMSAIYPGAPTGS
jgi:hypothetical protein